MKSRFSGKVVVVTGGGSGIGKGCSETFAEQGASVAIVDVDISNAEIVARTICEKGGSAFAVKCDISNVADVDSMLHEVSSRCGRIDIAINNAGIACPNLLTAETREVDFDRVLSTNLKGVWACMRGELRQMLEQNSGSIVNIASTMGLRVHPGNSLYVASKCGVAGLTRTAAVEYATSGIRVNAVCPGSVHTAMFSGAVTDPKEFAALKGLHPMNRLGTPAEIANAVLWLASDEASFVTGALLAVDGGWTAQ